MTKIRCPACRKGVAASEADAGQPVLCLACGRSFTAPLALAGEAGDSSEPSPAPAEPEAPRSKGDLNLRTTDTVAATAGRGSLAPADPAAVPPPPASANGRSVLPAASGERSTLSPASPTPAPARARPESIGRPESVPPDGEDRGRGLSWIGWVVAAGIGVAWLVSSFWSVDAPDPPAPAAITAPVGKGSDGSAPGSSEAGRGERDEALPEPPSEGDAFASPPGIRLPAAPPGGGVAVTSSQAPPSDLEIGEVKGEADAAGDSDDAAGDSDGAANGAEAERNPAGPPPGIPRSPRASASPTSPTTKPAVTAARPAGARPLVRRRGPLRPIPPPPGGVTDQQIEAAIRRGMEFLIGQADPQLDLPLAGGNSGTQFLVTYALLQSGIAVRDARFDPRGQRVDEMIERIRRLPIATEQATYQRSVRAILLALLNRPKDRDMLKDDVRRLVTGHVKGGYTYSLANDARGNRGNGGGGGGFPAFMSTDNSNSQYGLLGVWSGAEAAVEVPSNYWEAVNRYWVDAQLSDGAWSYTPNGARGGGNGYVTMAAAGTASLFVTYDQLSRRGSGELGRDPFPPALERALRWWETNDDWLLPVDPNSPFAGRFWGYQLYGIERVGLASGFKYFGQHDWYRALARQAVESQSPDGSWREGDPIETAFALLFLARGRPPIMMNKLRFDGYWANRPRDLSNLARFASHATERPLNWQIVDLRTEWHDWLDAPILYLASHVAPKFDKAEIDKLRRYALAGGMIFTHADGGRQPFDRYVTKLAGELFPDYELKDLPPDHPVYNIVAKVEPRPRLRAVSNGSRVLLLHSPTDVSRAWQGRDDKRRKNLFNLGLNLFIYATGKRDLRNRLDSPYVADPGQAGEPGQARDPEQAGDEESGIAGGGSAGESIRVARVRYAGHWDPEPGAWERFARLFHQRTGIPLEPVTVKWAHLTPERAPLAHLTGTALYKPKPAEIDALRAYVEGGGVLLVDNCGGMGAFAGELKSVLGEVFPRAVLDPVPRNHPTLVSGEPGMADLARPKYRPFTVARQGRRPGLYGFRAGSGQVLLTTLDLTSGLLHTGTWGIYGYDPAYCESLVQNVTLWAHDTQPH